MELGENIHNSLPSATIPNSITILSKSFSSSSHFGQLTNNEILRFDDGILSGVPGLSGLFVDEDTEKSI